MTKYNIYMHYYNDDIGKSVTNSTECNWYNALSMFPKTRDSKTNDFPFDHLNPGYEYKYYTYDNNGDEIELNATDKTERNKAKKITVERIKDYFIDEDAPEKTLGYIYDDNNPYMQLMDINSDRLEAYKTGKESNADLLEIIHISSEGDSKGNTIMEENTMSYEKYIISNSNLENPKYDMIFMWDGLGFYSPTQSSTSHMNDLYFDKMKRIPFKPWFFHSTYHSLRAVMSKAGEMVDLYGKQHIFIGKEVDLTQYIDIV